jgi:hypothetical protein
MFNIFFFAKTEFFIEAEIEFEVKIEKVVHFMKTEKQFSEAHFRMLMFFHGARSLLKLLLTCRTSAFSIQTFFSATS